MEWNVNERNILTRSVNNYFGQSALNNQNTKLSPNDRAKLEEPTLNLRLFN